MSYLGYPDFFEPYIKKVEQTRPARVEKRKKGEEFPFMSLQERQEILKYHPDYTEEGRREIKIGPNKGYRIAHEFVDLLEARSRVDPDKVENLAALRMSRDPGSFALVSPYRISRLSLGETSRMMGSATPSASAC
jgi:hypothetical protein